MKKAFYRMKVVFAALLLTAMILPAGAVLAQDDNHKPITLELIDLVEKNPEIGTMLEVSIAEAKKINPDPKTNPVQGLQDYYDFIDKASQLIPQEILDNPPDLTRDQIMQSLCYFYFLVGQPVPELKDKGLFRDTIQYYEPFSAWLVNFAKTWGSFLETEESWSEKTYDEFYKDPHFGLQEDWYESPSNWNTFNRFFSKYLRSPDVRPIASPDDPSVVVSPADSVPQGTWEIDENSNIKVGGGLTIKLIRYYSVNDLLSADSQYKDVFANGTLTHTFLDVFDYHRYHFAVGGTVKEKKFITQNVALEVMWSPEEGKYSPLDSTGWQFTQTRSYVIVDTDKYGLVALIPMGMAQVSSVNLEDDVTVGSVHAKGDMLGNFLFGGSDFIMLFQEEAGFEITAPKDPGAAAYKHILMGTEYGVMKGQAKSEHPSGHEYPTEGHPKSEHPGSEHPR
ncbi:phosphatidylserine decarboxylase [Candidatus Omnitrophota bacterium]